ncbi:formate dehydrogenase accessory sulfurtransferase FdhD [Methanothrix harundinacea]|uniref:Formate dehydrogenase family accessory protein FdhD n=1 Tax=Methanothrix harundinacea (strain 6Ac) TaxID=1110509 RepID=G7WRG4_METH6|nr:formate dehydrogenase accessory sulfurtransferase FdhD [Methanothrix harundinacea]AET65705.1 Formate dehydrogenase family accessory protein FdhD [Methanothrix harundinacea 6Ac]
MKYQPFRALRFDGGEAFEVEERMPKEVELEIFANGVLIGRATITPSQEKEFVAGHLRYRGLIEDGSEILRLSVEGGRAEASTGAAAARPSRRFLPGGPGAAAGPVGAVRAGWILANLESTLASQLYEKTGGTHTSSLCSGEEILATAEDFGRLNTLEKIFGWAILAGVDLGRCYAVTSGRITGKTVEKASRFGVPIVASKGAVTTLAVEMAEDWGMTLVGFARQGRMNVYTGRDRVTPD